MTRKTTLRRTAAAAVATVLASGAAYAVLDGPAHAAGHHPAAAAGSKSFTFITSYIRLDGKDSPQVALIHGAVNGSGRDKPHGQSDVADFAGGTLKVSHPNKQSHFVPKVDPKTCYATFKLTGKFTIGHGTGDYAGVTGSGTYAGKGYAFLVKNADGSCNMKKEPKTEVFSVVGTGTTN